MPGALSAASQPPPHVLDEDHPLAALLPSPQMLGLDGSQDLSLFPLGGLGDLVDGQRRARWQAIGQHAQ